MLHVLFRPRNPIARLVGWVLGLLAVAAVLALGVFALAALVFGGTVFWLVNALRKPTRAPSAAPSATPLPDVIDGEFTVIRARPEASVRR